MDNGAAMLFLIIFVISMAIMIYGMRLKARRTERLADLYEKAMAQGLDPREINFQLDDREGDPQGNLKAGIILLASTLGLFLGIAAAAAFPGPARMLGFAFVPGMIGLGAIYIHFAIKPRPAAKLPPAGEQQEQSGNR
ncbi:MAG: hypothetical protein H7A35_05555 [Planctomycetales bacterium]|nr:hypothetical protein [bacterium]UNM09524.1 MAG: hypothetical protein H7A35_05555 [Planctomycetales bacterium]